MHVTQGQFSKIERCLPVQRGNVKMDNLAFVRALLYVVENGCKWRTLPAEFGSWNSVYKKVNRWAKSGVPERLFPAMQADGCSR